MAPEDCAAASCEQMPARGIEEALNTVLVEGSQRLDGTALLSEALKVTAAMAKHEKRHDVHAADSSIGLSPEVAGGDEEESWTPLGIADEPGYSPDCSCDGDDPVNIAGRRDLTEWWNSGKRLQEQYPAPSGSLDMRTANSSIGPSTETANDDGEEAEEDLWAPLGIADEQDYSPDCSCDGDDPVSHASGRDLTEWWNSGKRFQEQYPAPSCMGAVGECSTVMNGNIRTHECHDDACGSTSVEDPSAQPAPPLPSLLASPLARCAPSRNAAHTDLKNSWNARKHVSDQHDAPSRMHVKEGSHADLANVHNAGSHCEDCSDPVGQGDNDHRGEDMICCSASSREEDGHDDCDYNEWNPGGLAYADEGYAPSCPCP
eukprot:TRINITY_DN1110_c0_g1_i1.p1 TRINITY_DN1110_c0_g1~~TRINITY_DN1110_c0_g1_i1.p1  ORF type:complete len:414 (+),score=74.94 TRINITY_DN1110_c0_g1_i1:122-1243(+)